MRKAIIPLVTFVIAASLGFSAQSPANSEEQTALASQPAAETPKHNPFRRTTFLYTRPLGIFGKLKGGAVTSAPRELFGSRKAARLERLSQQQARIEQGFSSRFAQRADTTALSVRPAQDPFVPAEASKPRAPRQTQPGEFRPTIYGLE